MVSPKTSTKNVKAPHVKVSGPSTKAPTNMLPFQNDQAGSHFTVPATGSDASDRMRELTL